MLLAAFLFILTLITALLSLSSLVASAVGVSKLLFLAFLILAVTSLVVSLFAGSPKR